MQGGMWMWLERSKSRCLVVAKVFNIDYGARLRSLQMRHNIGPHTHSNQVKPGESGVKQTSVGDIHVTLLYRFAKYHIWEK